MTDITPLIPIDEFRGEYRFLSNFYPATVVLDGHNYPTVEHAYQASKTDVAAERVKFMSMAEQVALGRIPPAKAVLGLLPGQERAIEMRPGQARTAGQRVSLRPNWHQTKIAIMEGLLRQKFADADLRAKLLATGDRKLIEGNNWGDRFWGVCEGRGENWLGRLLVVTRMEIQLEDARASAGKVGA